MAPMVMFIEAAVENEGCKIELYNKYSRIIIYCYLGYQLST